MSGRKKYDDAWATEFMTELARRKLIKLTSSKDAEITKLGKWIILENIARTGDEYGLNLMANEYLTERGKAVLMPKLRALMPR